MTGVYVTAEFRAHCTFISNHIWPGAAKARRTHSLMGIHHNVVLCSLHHGIVIMIDKRLAVVVLSVRDDVSDIAALHCIVAVLVHKVVGSLHMALIVHSRGRTLVVHYEADAFAVGILVKRRKVKIRVRGDKVKHIVLLAAEPVFPAFVPTLYEKSVKAVFCGKVNVHLHIFRVGAVEAVGFRLGIVRDTQLN